MTGCVNTCLKHFTFLDHNDTIKKRIELEEYFSQPLMISHLDRLDLIVINLASNENTFFDNLQALNIFL